MDHLGPKEVTGLLFAAGLLWVVNKLANGNYGFLKPTKAEFQVAERSNKQYNPSTPPIGIFLGGTSGVGEAMATQLAKQTNGRAHIIILGRNEESAKRIISGFPHHDTHNTANKDASSSGKYEFIKIDATSMKSIREVTQRLRKELPKVNFIVTSTGAFSLKGPDLNSEGIDRNLACYFYARFRLIYDLAPLVEKAAEKGEDVGVMSILAAGRGGRVEVSNLGLLRDYSLMNQVGHSTTYMDCVFEELASTYANVPFIHIHPGSVATPLLTNFPVVKYFLPLMRMIMVITPEESAQMMWTRMWTSNKDWKRGAFQVNNRGQDVPRNPYVTPKLKAAVWIHAIEMTG